MSTDDLSNVASHALPGGLAALRRLLATIGRAELVLAIIALAIVVVLAVAQALLRYFGGASLWWAQEVSEHTVLVTYFLGIAYVFKTRQEIFIEFLTLLMPLRVQTAFFVFEQICAFVFSAALIWLIYLFAPTMFNMQSPLLKLPGYVTYIPLLLSTTSIALTSIYYGWFGLWARGRVAGRSIHDVESHGLILKPWVEPT